MPFARNGDPFNEFVYWIVRGLSPYRHIVLQGPMMISIDGRSIPLEDLWRMVQGDPERDEEIVTHYFTKLIEGEEEGARTLACAPFAVIQHRIMPRIQPTSIFKRTNPNLVAHVPFVNETVIVFVVDLPDTTMSLSAEQLLRWGVFVDDLEQIARHNLRRYRSELPAQIVDSSEGGRAALLSVQDGYDASRILLSDLHEKLAPQLGSDFHVAIPARDLFLAFTAEPKPFVERLQGRVRQDVARLPYPITDKLFVVTRDGVAGTV